MNWRNPVLISVAVSVVGYAVTFLTPFASSAPWVASAIFVLTVVHNELSSDQTASSSPQSVQPTAGVSPTPASTPPPQPSPTVTNGNIPVNTALVQQIKSEGYSVFVNPTMPDGIVYGIGSPSGYTYWSTQQTSPILVLGPGVVGTPPGTGAKL